MRRVSRCSGGRWSWELAAPLAAPVWKGSCTQRDSVRGRGVQGTPLLSLQLGPAELGWSPSGGWWMQGGAAGMPVDEGHSRACSLGLGLLKSNIYLLLQLGVSQSLHAPSRCWQTPAVLARNRGWGSAWAAAREHRGHVGDSCLDRDSAVL